MSFLRRASGAYLARRLLEGNRRSRGGGYGRYARTGGRAYGRRSRKSGGFGLFGPFPTYSRRTRGGSRVTVGGCCLPIPLALTLGGIAAAARLVRR